MGRWAGAPGQGSLVSYVMNGSKSEIPQLVTSEQPPALLPAFQDHAAASPRARPQEPSMYSISQEARRLEGEPGHSPGPSSEQSRPSGGMLHRQCQQLPWAELQYSLASGPCLFRASDRCLTRKSCSWPSKMSAAQTQAAFIQGTGSCPLGYRESVKWGIGREHRGGL